MSIRYLPSSNNPIHLLRALLRECTYLPDPASRPILTHYIAARFRDYHSPRNDEEAKRSKYPPSPARKSKIITAARRGLSLLIRANQGDVKPLLKVLLFTYGRAGKRRRELISDLAGPDVSPDDNDEGRRRRPQWRVPDAHRTVDMKDWPARSERLVVLMQSQIEQQLPHLARASLKKDAPQIPTHNAWMRPLPKKRERNLRWRFYSVSLDKVMPPLPEVEWLRLRDLANGTRKWDGPVPRRRSIRSPDDGDDDEGGMSLLNEHLFTAPLDKQRYRLTDDNKPHHLTARFMRRLWGRVFIQCPRMIWEGQGKGWRVEWGMDELNSRKIRTANRDEMALFDDLEDGSTVDRPISQPDEDDSNDGQSSMVDVESADERRPLLRPDDTL